MTYQVGERLPGDSQAPRRSCMVSRRGGDRFDDESPAQVLDLLMIGARAGRRDRRRRVALPDTIGGGSALRQRALVELRQLEMLRLNDAAGSERRRQAQHVLELPYIARPRISAQALASGGGKPPRRRQ